MKIFKWILISILVVSGFSFLYKIWPVWNDYQKSGNWKMAKAEILYLGWSKKSKRMDRGLVRYIECRYRYQVDGQDYYNNRVSFNVEDNRSNDPIHFQELGKIYQNREQLNIYYNPDDISESVIFREPVYVSLVLHPACALFCFFLAFLVHYLGKPVRFEEQARSRAVA